ncbi:MAG: PAS domain S-box protein [Candidatus Marinimicrobia bacterium]|nr:PAS domain S-box protein [Candidatus Neomarinimicrobiota bacterium]MCF7828807.1 PAS domain S-box protein [Candidatus Neomarinimicrobiota bacterium]MCF7880724.1 PAS domain S-box protein [Candidatus Neomarinimicrobiota bacterium]
MTHYNILVIEDNPGDARLIKEYLSRRNGAEYSVEWDTSLTQGIAHAQSEQFDIALLDLGLPECRGKETFIRFTHDIPYLPVVVLTGLDDKDLAVDAVQSGAQDYLVKSELDGPVLKKALQYAIERWKFTRAYQESEEKFRLIAETSQDLIFQLNSDGEILYASPAVSDILEYSQEDVTNRHFTEFITSDDQERALDIFGRAISGKTVQTFELIADTKSGDPVPLDVNVSTFKIDDTHIGIQGIARDITSRKTREEELQTSEREYRTLFENLQDVFYRADLEGNVTMTSPSVKELLGYTPEEIAGKNLIEDIYLHRETAMQFWREIQQDGAIRGFETQLVRKDGEIIWVLVNAQIMKDTGGNPTGIEGIVWDITSQKEMEKQIRRQAKIDEAVSRASQQFVKTREADLDKVLKILGEAVDVNRAYIFGFSKNTIKVSNTHEWCDSQTDSVRDELQNIDTLDMQWWMEKILNQENIVLRSLNDLPEEAEPERMMLAEQGIKSLLAVPIESSHNTLGFLGFDDTENRREWGSEEIRALRVLAEMIGFYWERQRSTRRERVFSDLGRQLSGATTPPEAAEIIAEAAEKLIGWDACSVDAYDPDEDVMNSLLTVDIIDGEKGDVPPVGSGRAPGEVARKCLVEGAQLILRDENTPPDQGLRPFGSTDRLSASLMFAPIRHKDRPIGIISIQSYEYYAFDRMDLEILQVLADHCAGALERTQAERALLESERDFRGIFDNMQEGFFRLDADGTIIKVNPRMLKILDCEEKEQLIGKQVTDFEVFSDEETQNYLELLQESGEITNFQNTWSTLSGRQIEVRKSVHTVENPDGSVLYYEGTVSDITEQKELERQLIHAQKMESLGQIASGIAHDFNNVMATISGANQMLEMLSKDSPEAFEKYLKMISSSIERGKSITNRMLTFTRTEQPNFQPISAMNYLEEIREITGTTLPKNVLVNLNPYEGNDRVIGDRGQLQQVLMNLCINAADAMEGGGQIDLAVSEAPQNCIRRHDVDQELEYLCITVSDNGPGIPEEFRESIFEPFFTTKDPGKGTGLGLAVAYKIIKNHGGWIDVESTIGEGTIFTLGLPQAKSGGHIAAEKDNVVDYRGNGERILVIDDEKDIREIMTSVLTEQGYTVITAFSGPHAMEKLQESDEPFDLIITDLGMPDFGGKELIKRVLRRFPNQRVVGNTGYLDTFEQEELKELGFDNIIQKPFKIEELLRVVNTELQKVV